ncbi:hypothetical protein O7635_24280 [Asanoa sp. WMMD1127]|uniref:hypothetical protein n=1 Tax=Asanoa sp. WMMD1127 TaxID=3016107 RepID=UPI002416C758|nr:hypothetical protein [Asanoa sp. WMMD1127]MDG4824978.1 hypothetical protein [Asanoa sp. WMMD1127]
MARSDGTAGSPMQALRTFVHRRDTLIAALETAVAAYGEESDEVSAAHKAGIEYALRMVRQFLDVDVIDIPGLDPFRP